jgi:hypothetical protein
LQRFIRLSNPERFALGVSLMILALLPQQAPAYLVIDRSNWKLYPRVTLCCELNYIFQVQQPESVILTIINDATF